MKGTIHKYVFNGSIFIASGNKKSLFKKATIYMSTLIFANCNSHNKQFENQINSHLPYPIRYQYICTLN